LVAGWSLPEEAHAWNDGLLTTLNLSLEKPSAPCTLVFEGQPFVNASCSSQDLTLYVNGFFIGFWRLTEPRDYRLTASLHPEHFLERDGHAVASFCWMLPQSTRPADIGLAADDRQLGFCFRTFLLAQEGA